MGFDTRICLLALSLAAGLGGCGGRAPLATSPAAAQEDQATPAARFIVDSSSLACAGEQLTISLAGVALPTQLTHASASTILDDSTDCLRTEISLIDAYPNGIGEAAVTIAGEPAQDGSRDIDESVRFVLAGVTFADELSGQPRPHPTCQPECVRVQGSCVCPHNNH